MNARYHINVFWSEEDGCWIADVPDLRPCSAHGETPVAALEEAQVAIQLWLDVAQERGFAIPEPCYRPAIYASRHAA